MICCWRRFRAEEPLRGAEGNRRRDWMLCGDLDEVVAAEVNSALRSLQIVDVPARAIQQRGQPRLERALCHQLYHGSPAIQLYFDDDFECLRHGFIHRPHKAGWLSTLQAKGLEAAEAAAAGKASS